MASDGKILAEFIQGDFKLSMWIPSDLAGRVVGKRGVVITNLQRETRTKLMNALSPVGDSLWIAVVILGDWKSIASAYKAVSDIVSGEVDDVVLEFLINYRKPFFLHKRGKLEALKHISAKSNVRIFLPDAAREGNAHVEPMTLEGSFENVQRLASQKSDIDVIIFHVFRAITLIESEAAERESFDVQELRKESVDPRQIENIVESRVEEPRISSQTDPNSPAIKISSKDKRTLERKIDIPLNLVGLLLSRKPQLKISILNQIQGMTYTIISKILPTADISNKEEKDEIDAQLNEDDMSVDSALKISDQNETNHVVSESSNEIQKVSEAKDTPESEFVPFKIVGYQEENINMAYDHLERIINGERIKNVLDALKLVARKLPKPISTKEKTTKYKPKKP